MPKHKLQKLIEAMGRLEGELTPAGGEELSPEEVQKRTEEALVATEMMTERSLLSAMANVAPLAMQGTRVLETMDRRRQIAKDRAAKLAADEAKELFKELQDVFGVDAELRSSLFDAVANLEIPSVATLVLSALAPARLRLLKAGLQASFTMHAAFALISTLVLLFDRRRGCGAESGESDGLVPGWYWVDLAVGAACLVIRAWSLRRVGRAIEQVEAPPPTCDNQAKALRLLLDYYLTVGAAALEKYDELMASWLNALANWSVVFNAMWMCYGTWLVFNYPWAHCATVGLVVLRLRVILFLVCLGPLVVHLAGFFVSGYLHSNSFAMTLVSAAASVDEVLGLGMPVATIAAKSMVIRSSRDLTNMQLRRCEIRKYELRCEQDEAEATLQKVGTETTEVDAQIARLEAIKAEERGMTENELKLRHLAARDKILDNAQLVFGRLTGKAQELSRAAELQVERWEEEGGIPVQDLLGSGMSVEQVRECVESARRQAEDSVRELTQATRQTGL
mmetsp:Transcript_23265/g.72455  ORF Transcript_23265/g.72455 Transcript_23265/m.72455 type:complete len:508 (-) Transcript_23265:96-1619(-)